MEFKIHNAKIGVKHEYLEVLSEKNAYVKNGVKKHVVYYTCKETNCIATGKLTNGIFSRIVNKNKEIPAHNHPDHSHFLEILDLKQNMKNKAQSSLESYENIFEKSIKK